MAQHHHHDLAPPLSANNERDPVCGMMVNPATSPHRAEFDGKAFHFCAAKCREKFVSDPALYLSPPDKKLEASATPGAIYTCPMHPQVRQVGPGSCPICGMALEPENAAHVEEGPNAELVDMTRRFWIGVALAAPVFVLEMGGHLTGLTMWLGQTVSNWTQAVLATPVVLWCGWP
ncbi:MAG: YHS domain-containing protein, partial [Alphaproteobacteria bacterium]|nr:YHS domain-containing protein [Alphaproteobacteria bacterium]